MPRGAAHSESQSSATPPEGIGSQLPGKLLLGILLLLVSLIGGISGAFQQAGVLSMALAHLMMFFTWLGFVCGILLIEAGVEVPRRKRLKITVLAAMGSLVALGVVDIVMVYLKAQQSAPSSPIVTSSPVVTKPLSAMRPWIRSFLTPANDPTPPNDCDRLLSNREWMTGRGLTREDFSVFLMGSNTYAQKKTLEPFTVLRISGQDVLSVEPGPNGIVINTQLYDEHGALVATITKNVYRPYAANDYEVSGDQNSILILDSKDQVIFYVRYINSEVIKVLGMFRVPNKPPVIVEESRVLVAGNQVFGGCAVSTKKGAAVFDVD